MAGCRLKVESPCEQACGICLEGRRMARYRGRKPLYEVIRERRRAEEQARRSQSPPSDEAASPEQKEPSAASESLEESGGTRQGYVWPKRPRAVRFDGERLEVSVPYQVAVAVVLGVVAAVLLSFRLGQWQKSIAQDGGEQTGPSEVQAAPVEKSEPERATEPARKESAPVVARRDVQMVEPRGDHRIVIQQYKIKADLVPAQEYFQRHGIETEIVRRGNTYFLVTNRLFENPERPGTDGERMKQRIAELGRDYKPPSADYESFAPHYFGDAYGEKVR